MSYHFHPVSLPGTDCSCDGGGTGEHTSPQGGDIVELLFSPGLLKYVQIFWHQTYFESPISNGHFLFIHIRLFIASNFILFCILRFMTKVILVTECHSGIF